MPGPSSSTTSRTSRPRAREADVDRALRRRVLVRVHDEVLDDALELRPIDLGDDRLAVEPELTAVEVDVGDDPLRQLEQIDRARAAG